MAMSILSYLERGATVPSSSAPGEPKAVPLHQPQHQHEPWPRTQKAIVPKTSPAHREAIGGRGVREAVGDGRRAVRVGRGGS